ncbi:hypothetical protein ATE80_13805 [Streptomyces kanasensis]|uniref:Chaplin domain-containing protein n=1 Tax=Streptomyces kanasensis TaxID=936756 RepID=A0A117IWC2_9ACTN|nr:hypothetical protein ATE80_13805 [Streptomyces kanasensis]
MLSALTLTVTAATSGVLTAGPASAGGIGDVLSPAFGTNCANHDVGAQPAGTTTTAGTGAANGNLLGLPLGSPLNHCGGADLLPTGDGGLASGARGGGGSLDVGNGLVSAAGGAGGGL